MKKTAEDVVAEKLIRLLSDINLDLDEVGQSFTSVATKTMFIRLENVYLSACEAGGIMLERKRDLSDPL